MPDPATDFGSLPPEFQEAIRLAQDRHDVDLKPLEVLVGGRSGAAIYLVSAASRTLDRVEHWILKLDRTGKRTRADEITRHTTALSQAPPDFAQEHMPALVLDRVETEDAVAIFYTLAGQSLREYRTLSHYTRQSQLETIFQRTSGILLEEWNAAATFHQALHPQELLRRWLGFRLKPGQNIEGFLVEVCDCSPDTASFLIQGNVFPNPLLFARSAEPWQDARPIDALVGFIHGDLNTNNILAAFSRDKELEGYYLIDFALFKEQMPLLYDHCYLEMSYLLLNLEEVSLGKLVELITHFADADLPDPRQVPVEVAGACAVIGSARRAFDAWVRERHPSLRDDLWGQYWLAGVAAGLSYSHKAGLGGEARLLGLIYAAAHLRRYATGFGVPQPTQVANLYPSRHFDGPGEAAVPAPAPGASDNLPAQTTSLIGREDEIAAARAMLLDEGVRLVSLTGPGGAGKTRLGLEVAAEVRSAFQQGVSFVPLADITDPELVVSRIAQQLGIREGGSRPLRESLQDYLQDRQMLLLLDNFEQVATAASDVADLLAGAPRLKVLVTSRVTLNLRGEHEFPVPPLGLPEPAAEQAPQLLGRSEAVKLFVDRAQAASPDFALTGENTPVVAEICRRLDGLPLAIELAAARTRLLTPAAMMDRLSSSLKLLTGGAQDLPSRQQTLRNTLDWSYGLLDPAEKALFAWLGVFVGGFTLEAAEAVCDPEGSVDVLEGVASLVSNSLVRRETGSDGQPRFRMLQTIREYSRERLLERGELEALLRQHALHYIGKITTDTWAQLSSPDSVSWLDWLEGEHDNIRAALNWSQTTPEGIELGPTLIGALTWFWYRRGYVREGRAWAERVSASPAAAPGTPGRASALQFNAILTMWQGELNASLDLAEESIVAWRRLQDPHGMAIALMNAGTILVNMGRDEEAHPMLVEAQTLFKEVGDLYFYSITLVHLGNVALGLGKIDEALTWLEEAHAMSRELGEGWTISFALNNLGEVARVQGDYERARRFYEESESLLRTMGDKGDLARLVHTLAYLALRDEEYEEAEALFQGSLEMFRQFGNKRGIAECLAGLASLGIAQGRPRWAATLLGAAEALLTDSGAAWWPADRVEIARTRRELGVRLEADEFNAAWDAGGSLTLEGAVALASSELPGERRE